MKSRQLSRQTPLRQSSRLAKQRIHHSADGRISKRLMIHPDNSLDWLTPKEINEAFLPQFKKTALLVRDIALPDGTFLRMYALPDHKSDVEPWYILNVEASKLALENIALESIIDDEEMFDKYGDQLVNGPVLLTKVDEDGDECQLEYQDYVDAVAN
jgi:hypothetical protein